MLENESRFEDGSDGGGQILERRYGSEDWVLMSSDTVEEPSSESLQRIFIC